MPADILAHDQFASRLAKSGGTAIKLCFANGLVRPYLIGSAGKLDRGERLIGGREIGRCTRPRERWRNIKGRLAQGRGALDSALDIRALASRIKRRTMSKSLDANAT
jgi:hypothetical protein